MKSYFCYLCFAVLVSLPAEVIELQHQPTFPFLGIGWRYEKPDFPPAEEIINRPAPERPIYGLYCWGNEYLEYHDQIHNIGWTNFRFSGPMNDQYMRAYANDGVEVIATLSARLHGSFKPEAPMSDWRNRANYDSDEAFIQDYIAGITRFLERWGPEGSFFAENPDVRHNPIRCIEIFNEPNFWYLDTSKEQHADRMREPLGENERLAIEARREALYARLLKQVHDAVKARWSDVKIVGFAAGGSAHADVRFIENVHAVDQDVAKSYDILSTHPYVTRPCGPEGIVMRSWGEYSIWNSLNSIRATMDKYDVANKPIWYTEQGWAVNLRSGGSFVDPIRPPDDGVAEAATSIQDIPYDIDPRKWIDPLTQAAYITRMYALVLRMGVERHFFMSIVDTDGFNSGFLQSDGRPRQSAIAVKTMIELMPRPKLIEVIRDGEQGIFAYRFDPDYRREGDDSVVMAWAIELNKHSLPVLGSQDAIFDERPIQATSMLGDTTMIEPKDERIDIALGLVPIYLSQTGKH